MARTIGDIYNQMIAEKETLSSLAGLQPSVDSSQRLLSDLSSKSKVAVWRLLFWVVAVAIWVLENLVYEYKDIIEDIVINNHYGNHDWYNRAAKAFQKGDPLVVVNGVVTYATVDTTKQIVKYAATVPGTTIRLKVAGDNAGELEALLEEDRLLVQAYIDRVKPAGAKITVISADGDLLTVAAKIYFDPLVIRADGTLVSDSNTRPVDAAIETFLKAIEFDGTLIITKLVDAIQAVPGVEDVSDWAVTAEYGNTPPITVTRTYTSYAGWMRIDPDNTTEDTLEYIQA